MNPDFNELFHIIIGIVIIFAGSFLVYIFISYKTIINKKEKTEADITHRQKLITKTSFLFATIICMLPLMYMHYCEMTLTLENDISILLENGVRNAFLLSMIVIFSDNIIRRIISDIYVFKDIKHLNNFCLYLRSFNTDRNKQEKLICRITRHLFPIYAIGDPNSILQPNGAERIYVTDTHWKEAVEDLMTRCKLILMKVGQTDGTLWELNKLFEAGYASKTIFIVYTKEDYNWFLEHFPNISKSISLNTNDLGIYPYSFFVTENSCYYKRIKTKGDFKDFLNLYLTHHPILNQAYEQELELRNNSLKFALYNYRIPQEISKSFNWQFISPLIMMFRWPLSIWGLFILFLWIGGFMMNTFNISILWTIGLFFLFTIIKGNSIEWAGGGYSSPHFFFRIQHRKTMLMWYSYILPQFLAIFYYLLYSLYL